MRATRYSEDGFTRVSVATRVGTSDCSWFPAVFSWSSARGCFFQSSLADRAVDHSRNVVIRRDRITRYRRDERPRRRPPRLPRLVQRRTGGRVLVRRTPYARPDLYLCELRESSDRHDPT